MLLAITNRPRDYAWGSTTLLAQLEGRPEAEGPEAEVWFGDHPVDPSDLGDGSTLDSVTGGALPYLLKLLAAGEPLSIQVHPSREQAADGYRRESRLSPDDPRRNYRDANHKPELVVALSDRFEAFVGLRRVTDTLRLLDALPESRGRSELRRRLGTERAADVLRDVLRWLLSGASSDAVDDLVAGIRAAGRVPDEFTETLAGLRAVAERHPGDAGVAVALLMNHVVLRRGDALFLRAGLLHAYVSGLGVEIMAASDNVLRGGLTRKHVDVSELLAVVDTEPAPVEPQRGDEVLGVVEFAAPVDDFALRRVRVEGERSILVEGPAIVVTTEGRIEVASAEGRTLTVPPGTAAYASEEEHALSLRGRGEVFVAQPGRR